VHFFHDNIFVVWEKSLRLIKVDKKIADAFEMSLDYLVGEGQNASFDKKTLQRIQEIQSLDTQTAGDSF